MTGQKVKFTWNDQSTNRFSENLKIVFRVSARQGEIWYLQEPNKMLMPVFEVCISAVYDLPSMYYKILPMQKENCYNFIHEKAVTNIQSLNAFSFFSIIIMQAFVN